MGIGPRPTGDVLDGRAPQTVTRAQITYAGWAVTLLLYIVVLNLFVDYFDSIVIDSFTISILTAVLLLVLLADILGLEQRVRAAFAGRPGAA